MQMSLQGKILVIVLVVVSLYAALDYASQRFFILPSFIALEHNEAEIKMRRCVGALRREISNLDKLTKNWAASDEAYEFVKNKNSAYSSTNLGIDSLERNKLNVIYICDIAGKVVWGEVRDPETREIMQLDELPAGSWSETHLLLAHKTIQSSIAGIFLTQTGPMVVASRPIITSIGEGPVRGTLITGRFLCEGVFEAIAAKMAVDIKVWTVSDGTIPAEEKDVFINRINAESQFHTREVGDDFLRVYTSFADIRGVPALLMRADIPRDIRAKGISELMRSSLLSNLTAGLSVVLVLFLLLRWTVIAPIAKLTNHALAIGKSKDVSARLSMQRTDEIGTLAQEFDHMVEQLAKARKKLLEQSYYSGMSEMASGVLHNVRNLLTPMVSRIDRLRHKLAEAPLGKIEMAQANLAKASPSSQSQNDLINFITLASERLVTVVREVKEQLDDVAGRLTQIEQILFRQGKFESTEPFGEKVRLDELVPDSIGSLPDGAREEISIEIDPCIGEVEPLTTSRIALLQVFNNILVNAVESIHKAGSIRGEICIRAETDQIDGADMIHIRIGDNGAGIDPRRLKHIFERGFSTRQGSPSGIGLHWCANVISKMNGRIYAESDGTGRGACFHILLPVSRKVAGSSYEKAEAKS